VGDTVYWLFDGHRLEFTREEFLGMVTSVHRGGLFKYLRHERPALYGQLIEIARSATAEDTAESELEFILEQSVLNLNGKL